MMNVDIILPFTIAEFRGCCIITIVSSKYAKGNAICKIKLSFALSM